MKSLMLFGVCCAYGIWGCAGQNFRNLDFEQTRIVWVYPDDRALVYSSDALPGWVVTANGRQADWVGFSALSGGLAAVSVHNGGSPQFPLQREVLAGGWSVVIQGAWNGSTSTSIAQTGLIEWGMKSFRHQPAK